VILTVLFLATVVPSAARATSIREGTLELDARFSFQHSSVTLDLPAGGDDDYGYTVFDLNGGVGYFLSSRIEVAGYLVIESSSVDNVDDSAFGLLGRGTYHFNASGNLIPFAGVGVGFLNHGGDFGDEAEFIFPELVGGVRVPFEDVVSMNFSAGYRHRFSAYGFEDAGANEIFMGFGFSVFFEGGVGE
jgi:hypothetical protein